MKTYITNRPVSPEFWYAEARRLANSSDWRIFSRSGKQIPADFVLDMLIDAYYAEDRFPNELFLPENYTKLRSKLRAIVYYSHDAVVGAYNIVDSSDIAQDHLDFLADNKQTPNELNFEELNFDSNESGESSDEEFYEPDDNMITGDFETAAAELEEIIEMTGTVVGDFFGLTDRRGRQIVSEIKADKTREYFTRLAKQLGISMSELRRMAAECGVECLTTASAGKRPQQSRRARAV